MANSGLITGIVVGIAALVITVLVAFVIVSNVSVVGTDLSSNTKLVTITNESGTVINSGHILVGTNTTAWNTMAITKLYNNSDDTEIDTGNITFDSTTGTVTNSSARDFSDALISYTYYVKETSASITELKSNFSGGIENVSNKLPTILLIVAVVLILGVLALLWNQFKSMDIGGGEGKGGSVGGEL